MVATERDNVRHRERGSERETESLRDRERERVTDREAANGNRISKDGKEEDKEVERERERRRKLLCRQMHEQTYHWRHETKSCKSGDFIAETIPARRSEETITELLVASGQGHHQSYIDSLLSAFWALEFPVIIPEHIWVQ